MWDSVFFLCFVLRDFVSILVVQYVFLVYRACYVVLSHDATGLSAVCDCGIS